MALTKNLNLKAFGTDVIIKDAYIKVENVDGNKLAVNATVTTYTDNKLDVVKSEQFSFVPDMFGGNFIRQAYEHLKTLPELEGAKDC